MLAVNLALCFLLPPPVLRLLLLLPLDAKHVILSLSCWHRKLAEKNNHGVTCRVCLNPIRQEQSTPTQRGRCNTLAGTRAVWKVWRTR